MAAQDLLFCFSARIIVELQNLKGLDAESGAWTQDLQSLLELPSIDIKSGIDEKLKGFEPPSGLHNHVVLVKTLRT